MKAKEYYFNALKEYEMHMFDPQYDRHNILPDSLGIYMICAKDEAALELFPDVVFSFVEGKEILYIGISKSLRNRGYRNHFNGLARNSTVRKSFGALFGWQTERVTYDDGRYKFTSEREHILSQWMKEHLIMFYWLIPEEEINIIETRLINELSPPLNLEGNHSENSRSFREQLSLLRH